MTEKSSHNDSDPADVGSLHSPTTNTINTIRSDSERPVGGVFLLGDSELPFRFKQSTFLQYEPYLAQAIRNDAPIEINPSPLRATTFAARARDAIIAKKRFNWPASFTALELEVAELVVKHGEQAVVIAPRHTLKGNGGQQRLNGQSRVLLSADAPRVHGIIVPRDATQAEVVSFATLLDAKLISGPIIFKACVDEQLLDSLQAKFDIAVLPKNNKAEIIML